MRRPREPNLPPGTDIGGMRIVERVGGGGFGTVYKAVSDSGLVYAVKFIALDVAEAWARRELQATLKLDLLNHKNLVRMRASGHHPALAPEFMWMAFEFIEGRPLDEWARQENPDAAELVRKLLGVVRGLAVAHSRRVVHRDVKEANILVRESDGEAVLIDFGAGWFKGAVTITEGVFPPGTPDYRAPEAWRFALENKHQPRARYRPGPSDDLYALGVVLYALLAGPPPFRAHEEGGVRAILNEPPLPPHVVNPRVPVELGELCLAFRPETRPAAAPAVRVTPGQEVAPPGKAPEAQRAAAPLDAASTPATDAPRALPPQETPPVKLPPPQQRKQPAPRLGAVGKALTVATCTALAGCPSGPPVRPAPPSAPCPAGAVDTMEDKFDIDILDMGDVVFPVEGNAHRIAVREGINFLRLSGDWRKLPSGTVLTVQLFFADRIYGRVTQARTPSGDTFPVCMELIDVEDRKRGALIEPGSGPDKVLVFSSQSVKAVREFK